MSRISFFEKIQRWAVIPLVLLLGGGQAWVIFSLNFSDALLRADGRNEIAPTHDVARLSVIKVLFRDDQVIKICPWNQCCGREPQ